MDLGIAGKKALVTGAGRGLGQAIALALAAEGVKVAAVSRTASDIDSLVSDLGGEEAGHLGLAMDLVPEGAPLELVRKLAQKNFATPDIVVHNLGGTLDINDPFCSVAEWRHVWRFNIEVAIELNLAFLPHMRKQKWGRVVHISSISSTENHGPVPYCSVKAALNAYTRSMGRVVAADEVILTSVLPGAVFTAGGYWDQASKERPEHVRKYLDERMAIKRFGKPEEISKLVTFICSEHASFCVGSVVPADGGQGRGFFGY